MSEKETIPTALPPAEDAGSQALSDALRSSFFIVKIIMVVLVIAFLCSGIFTVGPQERAILLRLGRPVGEGENALLKPGFHWAFPSPIDEIVKIPYTALQKADSSLGWYNDDEASRNRLDPAATSYVLSSDTNIVHARAEVSYRITDPIRFYFDFTNAASFVTNALNNALLYAAIQFRVDDILTRNGTAFREAVTARMQELVHEEDLGITLELPLGVDAAPPPYLKNQFDAVVSAGVKRDNARSQAESYATAKLADARGSAATQVYQAQAASARVVATVNAEAKKFNDVRSNPEFYQRLLQMEALEQVYQNAQEKILEPHRNARELRINLSREAGGPSTNSSSSTP